MADGPDVGIGVKAPTQHTAQHPGFRAVWVADVRQSRRAFEGGVVAALDSFQGVGVEVHAGALMGSGASVFPPEIQRETACRRRCVEDYDGGIDELGADAIPGDESNNVSFHGVLSTYTQPRCAWPPRR